MSQDKNNEVYNYDKIFQKYSTIFRNPKYEVYDLEKFIFLIEIKVVHSEELKPKIFDPLETVLNIVMVFIIASTVLLLCSQDAFFCVLVLAVFTYIALFFMVNILRTKSINQMTEYSNTKKKYLIIKKCIENEIVRRKDCLTNSRK